MASWPETFRSEYGPSYFIALVLSVIYNFTINRRFTFKSAANIPVAMLKVFGFYCIFTPLSIWWGDALTTNGWNEYVVLAGTMVINFITEFLFTRFVVYRNRMFTNKAGQAEINGNVR
ncbi:MAG: GtrA family protein [Christensenellales bacterium]